MKWKNLSKNPKYQYQYYIVATKNSIHVLDHL